MPQGLSKASYGAGCVCFFAAASATASEQVSEGDIIGAGVIALPLVMVILLEVLQRILPWRGIEVLEGRYAVGKAMLLVLGALGVLYSEILTGILLLIVALLIAGAVTPPKRTPSKED